MNTFGGNDGREGNGQDTNTSSRQQFVTPPALGRRVALTDACTNGADIGDLTYFSRLACCEREMSSAKPDWERLHDLVGFEFARLQLLTSIYLCYRYTEALLLGEAHGHLVISSLPSNRLTGLHSHAALCPRPVTRLVHPCHLCLILLCRKLVLAYMRGIRLCLVVGEHVLKPPLLLSETTCCSS